MREVSHIVCTTPSGAHGATGAHTIVTVHRWKAKPGRSLWLEGEHVS